MLLAIDIGNSHTTLGLFEESGGEQKNASGGAGGVMGAIGAVGADFNPLDKPKILWRMTSSRTDTADMLHERLCAYFAKDGFDINELSALALASVVPDLGRAWSVVFSKLRTQLGRSEASLPSVIITPQEDYGLLVDLPQPKQLGADRIANAVAAITCYGAPSLVVDFGTATNIDVVNQAGAYCGGSIAPGLMLSAHALFSKAAKLSQVPIELPPSALANTTETAVQAGLVLGAAAQAEGLCARVIKELGCAHEEATVIATGGLGTLVSKATDLFDVVDPDLTLRGIRIIWHRVHGSLR